MHDLQDLLDRIDAETSVRKEKRCDKSDINQDHVFQPERNRR